MLREQCDLHYGCQYLPTFVEKGMQEWVVRISQEPPTWEGNYLIGDMTDLHELDGFTEITDTLKVMNFESLTSLSGLESIVSIGGSLVISDNDALASLEGLSSDLSIGGSLVISDNTELCEYKAEELRDQITIGGVISIENNKDCSVP